MGNPHESMRKGRAAEYIVAAWLLRNNDVWVSIMPDSASTDLIIQSRTSPDKRWTIQVKAMYWKERYGRRKRTVNLVPSSGVVYQQGEADQLIVVDVDNLGFWVFPYSFLKNTGYKRLRLTSKYLGHFYSWDDKLPWLQRLETGATT